ncbi:MAG TPA: hypothetical protein VIK30_13810, partial [Polyangia bacterium]
MLGVVFCRRWRCTTTVGTSTTPVAGVLAGCGVLGCGVLVVEVFAGCAAVSDVPVAAAGVAGVGVVIGAVEPSPGDGALTGVSAASAPLARGPP